MAAAKRGRFVMEMFITGRKHEIMAFMGEICSDHEFKLKFRCIAH